MKLILLLIFIFASFPSKAQSPWFFGDGEAVNLTNGIKYNNGIKNIAGSLDPSVVAVDAPIGSLYESANGRLYVKQDAGATTNWTPLASSLGTANTFAGYDALGGLYSLPGLNYQPLTFGLYSFWNSDTNSHASLNKFDLQNVLGDGIAGDADDYTNLLFSTSISAGYDLDRYWGIRDILNIDSTVTIDEYRGLDLLLNGDLSSSSTMAYINHVGDGTSMNMLSMNHTGDYSGFFTGLRLDNSGTIDGMYGMSLVNQASSTGQIEMINITNSGDTTANNVIMFNAFNNSVAIDGDFSGSNMFVNSTVSGGISLFNGGNDGTFQTGFTGINLYNNGNGGATSFIGGFNFNNIGTSQSFNGVNVNNGGTISDNILMLNLQDTSNSPAANASANIGYSGTYNSISGLRIDMSAATSNARKEGLNVNGGAINSIFPFTTTSSLPSVIDSGNALITSFSVTSGSPISDTSVIANNFSGLSVFNDDFSSDPFYNVGFGMVGFVGQLSVASTKTVDNVSMALAGASIPPTSTGGTVQEFMMYNARGALAAGGSISIDNAYAFRGLNGICTYATGCYGISIEDVSADNFIAKSLQIGGTRAPLNSSQGIKIGSKTALEFTPMTTTERNALSPSKSMVIYNETTETLDYYDGVAWVAVGAGPAILPLSEGGTNKNLTASNGSVVYSDADSFELTAVGTSGQVLQSTGAAAPIWVKPGKKVIRTISANDAALTSDDVIRVNASSGNVTLTLPAASTHTGYVFHIKKIDSSINAVIIDGDAAELIDGLATYSITDPLHTIQVLSNGTGWDIL